MSLEPPLEPALITRRQLAARCGLSLRTIDDLLSRELLPHFKIGKCIRFDLQEAVAAMRQHFHVQAVPYTYLEASAA